MSTHTNIMRLDLPGLQDLASQLGQQRYRGTQLAKWLYQRGVHTFGEMDNLPTALRAALEKRFMLEPPRTLHKVVASDGTTRYLLKLSDGLETEAVAIFSGKRLTVCLSTQVGCAMGCLFCATGSLGLGRSLFVGEMLWQLLLVSKDMPAARVSNVVVMGQGEPFANYEACLGALRMLNNPDLFGVGAIGARHITVSSAGLPLQIRRFAHEPEQFTLAVSLHSAEQATRDLLMPGLATQSLKELREALLFYLQETSRRPSLEYALIKGVNDTDKELASLIAFCSVPAPGFHVNLIPLNATLLPTKGGLVLKPAPLSTLKRFEQGLAKAQISVSRRTSKGEEIAAACGQLMLHKG